MPVNFNNPSFEDAGSAPGLALDWTYATLSSLREFAIFVRGDAVTIVDTTPTTGTLGLQITPQDDGTIILTSALGATVAYEDFAYQWSSNQLYLFTIPPSYLTKALISNSYKAEDFEDGWTHDAGLLDSIDLLAVEKITDSFETWKPSQVLKLSFTPITFCTLKDGVAFADGDAHAGANYSNAIWFKTYDLKTTNFVANYKDNYGFSFGGTSITEANSNEHPTAAEIDPINGTLRPANVEWHLVVLGGHSGSDLTPAFGIADFISLIPTTAVPVGHFSIVGDPGLDLDRAMFLG